MTSAILSLCSLTFLSAGLMIQSKYSRGLIKIYTSESLTWRQLRIAKLPYLRFNSFDNPRALVSISSPIFRVPVGAQ
jgi:hypothetical protein